MTEEVGEGASVMPAGIAALDRRFDRIRHLLSSHLRTIVESQGLPMETPAQRGSLRGALPACRGVYVLYEGDTPMYVGRSDRLADRLLEHGRPSSGSESATFAFSLAYSEWRPDTDLMTVGRLERQAFQRIPEYDELFEIAKSRVRRMCVRVVEIADAAEQAVFEIYAHVALDTRYNSFANH